jgi:hypothetical protein
LSTSAETPAHSTAATGATSPCDFDWASISAH